MPNFEDPKIRAELIRLLEEQIELRELAEFVTLTDAEAIEYQRREDRILELLGQSDMLKHAA